MTDLLSQVKAAVAERVGQAGKTPPLGPVTRTKILELAERVWEELAADSVVGRPIKVHRYRNDISPWLILCPAPACGVDDLRAQLTLRLWEIEPELRGIAVFAFVSS